VEKTLVVSFFDESLKGDTPSLSLPESNEWSSAKQQRSAEEISIQQLVDQSNMLVNMMDEIARGRKKAMQVNGKHRNVIDRSDHIFGTDWTGKGIWRWRRIVSFN
jgi:hypothetical protein